MRLWSAACTCTGAHKEVASDTVCAAAWAAAGVQAELETGGGRAVGFESFFCMAESARGRSGQARMDYSQ
eukprot:366567-Chlamydomonas_euryale.AAC.5